MELCAQDINYRDLGLVCLYNSDIDKDGSSGIDSIETESSEAENDTNSEVESISDSSGIYEEHGHGGEIKNFLHRLEVGYKTLVYGFNDPSEIVTDPETGYPVELKLTPLEKVERDRDRVAVAFGLRVEKYMNTSKVERSMSFKPKKFVLIDLSGTLHIGDEATKGAINALNNLRTAGLKVLFVTNTTKESRAKLHKRLTKIGFQIEINEIFTSLNATRQFILDRDLRPFLMVAEEALEDFEGIDVSEPNAVVVGLSTKDFNYKILSKAARLLMKPEVELIAIHKARYYMENFGNSSLGPGPFCVSLEFATGKTANVLGKPSEDFYMQALKYIGCDDPLEAVMIGDDIRDDVFGAMKVGICGILVKTGKYSNHDVLKIAPHTPDYICEDFSSAAVVILKTVGNVVGAQQSQNSSPLSVN